MDKKSKPVRKKTLTVVYKESIFVNMRYHVAYQLLMLLGTFIGCLVLGCSNSEGNSTALNNAYYAIDGTEGPSELGKQSCFNSFRLPDLQTSICREQFYTQDTVTDFPQSGFYQKTFTILFPENKPLNCEIGGQPITKESPLLSAIQVDSSMVIQCTDFSEESANAEIIRTYILEKNPNIAAVFLTTDPNSLFNPDTGIYMEGPNAEAKEPHYGANYWLDKEIPVFVELVEPDNNNPAFAKHAGLKIFGNWSRMHAKKSVAITFRDIYGDKRLYYPLFPDFPELKVFKSFVLRNFGNNFGNDYIRDRLASSLSEGLGVDYQRGRYAIVYYNGKYFGLHDLRERANEYYFETHYGISHNNINLLKANNSVSAGKADDYIALMNWLNAHSLNIDSNYAYIASKIDIDNFINYMHMEIYANNRDWPGNNLKKWNSDILHTRWKWFLYDMDFSFGNTTNEPKLYEKNIFEYISSESGKSWINAPIHTLLFRSLLNNQTFKNTFINRMAILLQTNFKKDSIFSSINTMMNEINNEIPRDQKRWNLNEIHMEQQLQTIQDFAQNRPVEITNELYNFFNLNKQTATTFSTNGNGAIFIDNLPIQTLPFTAFFFEGAPITISAKPQIGSSWAGWSDGDTSSTRIILPEDFRGITAIFN